MLMEKPNVQIAAKVPSSEMGSVNPVMMVERHEPKNSHTINTANIAPSIKVRTTLFNEPRILFELSATTVMVTPGGRVAWISARRCWVLSTTSITLASDILIISIATAGWPFCSDADSASACPSTTWATCDRYTGTIAPVLERFWATMIWLNSLGVLTNPLTWITISWFWLLMVPTGNSTFSERSALLIWLTETL